jgi:hypothetical protein
MRVQVDLSALGLDTLRLTEQQALKLLKALAGRVIAEIRRMTNDGLDANGVPFASYAPYSPAYFAWKAKQGKGRTPGGPGDWLNMTGQMLKSLKVDEVTANQITVVAAGPRTDRGRRKSQKAKLRAAGSMRPLPDNDDVAFYVNLIREFMGVRPDFEDVLAALAADVIMGTALGGDATKEISSWLE